jgi:hypothetical protein
MKNYNVRIYNHKTGKVEYVKVDTEGLKRLIYSIFYDVFDIEEITE